MFSATTRALFHLKTLQDAMKNFTFPLDFEERHHIVLPWVKHLQNGTLDQMKEVSLHGDFLRDIFQDVLGYRSLIQGSGETWEIHAEQTMADGGGSADAAIGFFAASTGSRGNVKLGGRVIAPIELKGAKNDLDRPSPGRKESAVDQGWRYANYTPHCQWVIVSNYREIRLYQTSKTPAYYESFLLEDLQNLENFKRFYFILCRQNFLGKSPELTDASRIDRLLLDSDQREEAITKELYEQYKAVRLSLTQHFRRTTPKSLRNRNYVLIEKAQKLLDRILFIAFCEDCGLLPPKTLTKAYEFQDIYGNSSPWDRYKQVFRWVNAGNENPAIPGYNGGLFKPDPLLDETFEVNDLLCSQLNQLTRFDFATEVSVNILGRIFEQSITDLEELKAEAEGQIFDQKQGKRKRQGVYYTPAFITEYIVGLGLGGYLREQEQRLALELGLGDLGDLPLETQREREIQFWQAYHGVLEQMRVLDPACGSGAFLIAAFDYLSREYGRVDRSLKALTESTSNAETIPAKPAVPMVTQGSLLNGNLEPQVSLADPAIPSESTKPEVAALILSQNLYGVDLSPESVEITKLSLWLKTAKPGQVLLDLDDNIKVGNSIVANARVDKAAFKWQRQFPQVFAAGGFDVVLGNPPYVRQELLSPLKPYLQANYQTYDGVADLYVYFYEKGLEVLKPGGVLSYIVTNKWFKAGYGEPLRRFFAENTVVEQILDFGHAPIFEDADVFPCIISARKPTQKRQVPAVQRGPELLVRVCPIPREQLPGLNLSQYVQEQGYDVPWDGFTANAWSLEPPAVNGLMQKIQERGIPLKDFAGVKPYYGIKTGLNEAFLIDEATRNSLVQADPNCAEIIKPYLRGQDIKRWSPDWNNLWIILLKSSANHNWPWSGSEEAEAEQSFAKSYPSIYHYFLPLKDKIKKRQDQGHYWWELRACAYYDSFHQPKILYQEIQFHPSFSFDIQERYTNNKGFILPTQDLYILAVLNSPLYWWHNWRYLPHMKDEALTPKEELLSCLPVVEPTSYCKSQIENLTRDLIELIQNDQQANYEVLDWLQVEQKIAKLGQKLENFTRLDCDRFLEEVRQRQPKGASFGPKVVKQLREVYNDYAPGIQSRQNQALILENQLSDLVNQAYGLTLEDIDLLWKTAPPRMPIPRPHAQP
ncbi:Eco57I restriction-modification methylase domain-containing protein [Prochlorothrix hollandica]|uniref:Eco57I restriction-modification methylase domain-containing protein n=1 Tax=Prochlorothrix hollandica TaxID=1223 RepID=UPI00334236F5